ncbi:hypothetical protein CLI64_00235 [Nostoc sp. CENA543]|nr:hypothetical protein CLI64_00235 [Nostoc sp. CENA543]
MLVTETYPVFPFSPLSGINYDDHITPINETWVKLLHLPSEYSCDEAKLLCQESPNTWVAWIPDYGEMTLHESCFILLW